MTISSLVWRRRIDARQIPSLWLHSWPRITPVFPIHCYTESAHMLIGAGER